MRLCNFIPFLCCYLYSTLNAQSVSSLDLVKVPVTYEKEAIYFYEQNWKKFREAALEASLITGYTMLRSEKDSTGYFMLMRITEYADSNFFNKREEHFRPIMKKISPNGPRLLNDIPRSLFSQVIMGWDMETVFQRKAR